MELSGRKRRRWIAGLWILVPLVAFSTAAAGVLDPPGPEDPVALGAWLFNGYCATCHGSFEASVPGISLEAEELRAAISGDGRGCRVQWGILHGGPLTGREIDALVTFILAWSENGGPPDLSDLPVFPTFTPEPSPIPDAGKPTSEPPPTPLIETDPRILIITENNPVALGARTYTRRCYRCHLSYESGRMADDLDEERLKQTIEEGKPGTSMPAFGLLRGGNLRVREVNGLVAYILAFEALGSEPALPEELYLAPTPDPGSLQRVPLRPVPPIDGRVERGLVVYGEHCQPCHGIGGVGGIAPSLQKPWLSVRADLTIREAIVHGIPGTPMEGWGSRLDPEEINGLVALILEWSPVPSESGAGGERGTEVPSAWRLGLLALVALMPVAAIGLRRIS